MNEQKNIDRLFQEKFKDFEQHPSDAVWAKIAAKKKKDEDRKIVPLWWRLGGIAAALALLIGLGSVLFSNEASNQEQNTIVETNTTLDEEKNEVNLIQNTSLNKPLLTQQKDQIVSNESQSVNKDEQQNANVTRAFKRNAPTGNTKRSPSIINTNRNTTTFIEKSLGITSNVPGNSSIQKENIDIEKNPSIDKNKIDNTFKTNTELDAVVAENSIEKEEENKKKSLLEEAEKINEATKLDETVALLDSEPRNRWDVGAIAAPVYYGDFGGSGIDPQFSDNTKSGDVNLSYGVQISYAVNPKLKVRTGVNNVDLSYNTGEISFSPNARSRQLPGINYSQNAQALNITDRNSRSVTRPEDGIIDNENLINSSNGSLQQRLGFVEIPVEAVYVLSDKKVGVELVGGLSTLLLNNNEVILNSDDGLQSNLGTANGLNNLSFTTNIGLGVNYKMTDKIKFNVEPSLKYQLNAFDKSVGDFKPYFIGLYTGVSYRF